MGVGATTLAPQGLTCLDLLPPLCAEAEEKALLAQAAAEGGGKKRKSKGKKGGGPGSEAQGEAAAEAVADGKRGRAHGSADGSYWVDWEPVRNNPFYPANGLPGPPFLANEAAREGERCAAAHKALMAETDARNAMSPEERVKKKVEPLEPALRELEVARVTASSLTPARIDRWGVEYDCRWLSSARSKGFRQLRIDFTDIWRDDESEQLVVPGFFLNPQPCALESHPGTPEPCRSLADASPMQHLASVRVANETCI